MRAGYGGVNLLADIANQVEGLIGENRAIAVFRYAGKQLGKRQGEGVEGTEEDARALVAKFFQDKEFMDGITLEGNIAQLSGYKIGLILIDRGVEVGRHALCHFGFGLIDGTIEAVTGKKIVTLHVRSEHGPEGLACRETW